MFVSKNNYMGDVKWTKVQLITWPGGSASACGRGPAWGGAVTWPGTPLANTPISSMEWVAVFRLPGVTQLGWNVQNTFTINHSNAASVSTVSVSFKNQISVFLWKISEVQENSSIHWTIPCLLSWVLSLGWVDEQWVSGPPGRASRGAQCTAVIRVLDGV